MSSARGGSALLDPERVAAVTEAVPAARAADDGLRRLMGLASMALQVPVGFISIVDAEHEIFSAMFGVPEPWGSMELLSVDESVCRHIVESGAPLFIEDTHDHPWTRGNAAVQALDLRAWGSAPVTSEHGHVLGAFCVADYVPRTWTGRDVETLVDLAGAVSTELRLRVALAQRRAAEDRERRLSAQQAALCRVATAVARAEPSYEVSSHVIEEMAELLPSADAAVLAFERDGRVRVAANARESTFDLASCASALADLRSEWPAGTVESGPWVVEPVSIDGAVAGALVARVDPDQRQDAAGLLEALAHLVGLALSNAQTRERLVELSRTDPLTGAANRRMFDERLDEEIERARRHGAALTLALMDVDHFKRLNDTAGHVAGDRVLADLTARAAALLRSGDLLARLGGDEYALLLPDADYAGAAAVIDRIRESVESSPVAGLHVTVTIGAAVAEDGQASAESLYRSADRALYRAKAGGRNGIALDHLRDGQAHDPGA
ncbi:MAG: sensor domain-containing diguanylate cyclase [Actinomycetota bacterium]|nr:sensor domain-containing diguanylate cyclase [Actinomycetota bacterium]